MSKIVIDEANGCWLWTGHKNEKGYGVMDTRGNGKRVKRLAHRRMYEMMKGPIPAGLTLDHFYCQYPGCVNPDHVEPVTASENARRNFERGVGAAALNKAKHACKHGHEFTHANTYRDSEGKRHCRKCDAANHRRRYWEAKAQQNQQAS